MKYALVKIKPRYNRFSAIQYTEETSQLVQNLFEEFLMIETSSEKEPYSLFIQTARGEVKELEMGNWIVRIDKEILKVMSQEEFDRIFEIEED